MARLLYIEASPRKARSASIAAAGAFLDAYRATHPEDVIDVLDLWQEALPDLDETTLNARFATAAGQPLSAEEAGAWQRVGHWVDRLKAADKIVLSLPMWNFSVPYKLKHFIDIVTQPGLTFSYSPQAGYQGLLGGRKVLAIYARGGEYAGAAAGWDKQRPYVEQWLGFVGLTDIETVVVEPTLNPERAPSARQAATETAARLGRTF